MRRIRISACLCILSLTAIPPAFADEFDSLDGKRLIEILKQADVTERPVLTIKELASLPYVVPGIRSTFVIVRTDSGNVAKLLIAPGQRKPPNSDLPPASILFIERAEAYDGGNLGSRLARIKDLILFDGFHVDLDSGQVVPEGQGGDLVYRVNGDGGPRLEALPGAKIMTLANIVASNTSKTATPSNGRAVKAEDFAGKYRVYADGQWSGNLKLDVNKDSAVTGTFQSDLNGTSYAVEGEVTLEVPRQVKFSILYPRTRQEFSGVLFIDGKGALVGTGSMLGRPFAFFAVREGGRITPTDVEAMGMNEPERLEIAVMPEGLRRGGQPIERQAIVAEIGERVEKEPGLVVVLKVAKDVPYRSLQIELDALRAAGVGSIRLVPLDQ